MRIYYYTEELKNDEFNRYVKASIKSDFDLQDSIAKFFGVLLESHPLYRNELKDRIFKDILHQSLNQTSK